MAATELSERLVVLMRRKLLLPTLIGGREAKPGKQKAKEKSDAKARRKGR